jgi:hypothetical protein
MSVAWIFRILLDASEQRLRVGRLMREKSTSTGSPSPWSKWQDHSHVSATRLTRSSNLSWLKFFNASATARVHEPWYKPKDDTASLLNITPGSIGDFTLEQHFLTFFSSFVYIRPLTDLCQFPADLAGRLLSGEKVKVEYHWEAIAWPLLTQQMPRQGAERRPTIALTLFGSSSSLLLKSLGSLLRAGAMMI